ncbi:MAG: hypothetical protein M5R42_03450 [Rhodocyclaceae bacterium]|nr:hypothetical protein [Rhodocyclaceae bacterium]
MNPAFGQYGFNVIDWEVDFHFLFSLPLLSVCRFLGLLFLPAASRSRAHSFRHIAQNVDMVVELLHVAGERFEAVAQHARQFPRRHGRAAGDRTHLINVRLELAQPFFPIRAVRR